MTASFAAYASQFLNRQPSASTASSSSQNPLFFSFTTDDGSRAGDMAHAHEAIDDDEDPHLRHSSEFMSRNYDAEGDEDDPYLRLDEDDPSLTRTTTYNAESLPLIESGHHSFAGEPMQGWLAHQGPMSIHPQSPPHSDSSSDSAVPPLDLLEAATQPTPPPPPRTRPSFPLTESLLPRDGVTRPVDVFSLPDPRRHHRGRDTHKDSIWTALWLGSFTACVVGSFIILFTTASPRGTPRGTVLPYVTLLHTIPLLTILTFLSAVVSYGHIMLLRIFVKPVIFATSVFIPATLFVSAIWAFVGSFMWEEGSEPTWGETVGCVRNHLATEL